MSVKTFGVVGAGQMGNGIAQVAAMSGLNVIMNDIKEEFVERGLGTITKILSRNVDKGKMTDDEKNAVLGRIQTSVSMEDMASADFVVEAATENEPLKFKIFQDLDEICKSGVILATNTSSIPIGRIAAQTGRPDKVIGMHFMNPVPVMKLVEVIPGIATSEETMKITWELSERFGTREDIDTVMKLGMNHPMGPLTLADLIGLDTCLAIMETLYDGFKDSKYRPCPLLRKYVEAGWLGRKTGKGFYEYK